MRSDSRHQALFSREILPGDRGLLFLHFFQGEITGKELDTETGYYYFGARYLDPKTSRWISVDPAMGDYIPSAPVNDEARKRNQKLPNGGVYNYINLHAFHYANNNPIKYVDPDGNDYEEDIQNALNAVMASSPNATTSKLSDLVNTENLASIIKGNSKELDYYTGKYVNKSSPASLQNDLDNINVIMGVDKGAVLKELGKLGINAGDNPEAVTVGNTILVFGTMEKDSKGRVRDQGDADLLGHESIHSLQVNAAGGIPAYAGRYKAYSDMAKRAGLDPYFGSPLERAPYSFGPTNQSAQKAGSSTPTIFFRFP